MQISASGTLLHPESFSPGGPPASREELDRRRQWARAITDEIQKVRSARAPPRLEIRFQGDLSQPGDLRAVRATPGRCAAARLLPARTPARAARLRRRRVPSPAGGTHRRARHPRRAGRFQPGHGRRALPAPERPRPARAGARVRRTRRALRDFTFRDTPQLQLDGRTRARPAAAPPRARPRRLPRPAAAARAATHRPPRAGPLRATGRFDFERAETDFSWSGDRWYLRGLRLVRPGSGRRSRSPATCSPSRAQVNVRLTSTVDPMPFVGSATHERAGSRGAAGVPRPAARRTDRHRPLARRSRRPERRRGSSRSGARATGASGLNKFHGDWTFAGALLTARRNRAWSATRASARRTRSSYDLDKHEVRIDNARTNLDTGQVGVWLDPDVYHTIAPFHFHKPPADGHQRQRAVRRRAQFASRHGGQRARRAWITRSSRRTSLSRASPGRWCSPRTGCGSTICAAEIFGGQARGALDLALGHAAQGLHARPST